MTERTKRFPAKYPVVFRQGPEMYAATICNISSDGGCIVGAHPLAKGDSVVLDYSVGQTRAMVMWTMEKMAGLRFDSHLSPYGLNCIRAVEETA